LLTGNASAATLLNDSYIGHQHQHVAAGRGETWEHVAEQGRAGNASVASQRQEPLGGEEAHHRCKPDRLRVRVAIGEATLSL
jgi:hypothetical protein